MNRKVLPAPTHYDVVPKWLDAKPKEIKKLYATKRSTFIDDINNPVNVAKVPGVGKYNLNPTDEQIKETLEKLRQKKIRVSAKDNIFCNYEAYANEKPGAGNYNPHVILIKITNFRI